MELISINKDFSHQKQRTKDGIKQINKLIASDLAYSQLLTCSNENNTKQSTLFHQNSCTSIHKPKNGIYNGFMNNLSSSVNFNQKASSRNKPNSLSINSTVNLFEEKKALEDFCKSFELIESKKQNNKNNKYKQLLIPFDEGNKGKRDLFIDF